jgi:hypothetical protein
MMMCLLQYLTLILTSTTVMATWFLLSTNWNLQISTINCWFTYIRDYRHYGDPQWTAAGGRTSEVALVVYK